uniref:Uncharacterized protein n=1 Tax=Lotharella oceanica TaxID=641309 RepID=A0A7S2TZW1_9EUKA
MRVHVALIVSGLLIIWGSVFLFGNDLSSTLTCNPRSIVSAKLTRFPRIRQTVLCARRHPKTVREFARKEDANGFGDRVKEAVRQSIRDGGARPIVASDALRKIQTENPQLVAGIFAAIALALLASIVYGF